MIDPANFHRLIDQIDFASIPEDSPAGEIIRAAQGELHLGLREKAAVMLVAAIAHRFKIPDLDIGAAVLVAKGRRQYEDIRIVLLDGERPGVTVGERAVDGATAAAALLWASRE